MAQAGLEFVSSFYMLASRAWIPMPNSTLSPSPMLHTRECIMSMCVVQRITITKEASVGQEEEHS